VISIQFPGCPIHRRLCLMRWVSRRPARTALPPPAREHFSCRSTTKPNCSRRFFLKKNGHCGTLPGNSNRRNALKSRPQLEALRHRLHDLHPPMPRIDRLPRAQHSCLLQLLHIAPHDFGSRFSFFASAVTSRASSAPPPPFVRAPPSGPRTSALATRT